MKIIKTSEALPKSGRYVLAWLEGAKIPMRAMWAAQHTLPLGDDADPEWGEYSEEKDEYFCPAGWYEMNQHEEQHWGVSGNVVAWCELPRLEAGAAPAAVAGPAIKVPEDWMEHLGFELDAPADGVWMVIDDTGARREANLTERILWKELIAIRAAIQDAALAPAAPALEAPAAPEPVRESDVRDMIGMVESGQAEEHHLLQFLQRLVPDRPVTLAAAPQAPAAPVLQLPAARAGRIYVAGPMTGLPDHNSPAFNHAAAALRAKGWHVENPAEHGVVPGAEWADYLHYDMGRLATCEAIHLLPGWGQSRGAALEVHVASVLGMKFQYADGAEIYHPPAAAPAAPAVDALAPVQALLDVHAELLDANPYAYFELSYTRQTGWMAWITDKPMYGAQLINPDRKVLARGQGDTAAAACAAAAQAKEGGEA